MGLAKTKLSELAQHGYVHIIPTSAKTFFITEHGGNLDSFVLCSVLLMVRDLLERYGVRIRFIGRRDMLPPDVLEAVDEMESMTSGNAKWVPLSYISHQTGDDD